MGLTVGVAIRGRGAEVLQTENGKSGHQLFFLRESRDSGKQLSLVLLDRTSRNCSQVHEFELDY